MSDDRTRGDGGARGGARDESDDGDEYREEATWAIRIEASAAFGDDYDGELDGYAWRDRFYREVQPRVLAAVLRELEACAGWRVRTGNRGMSAHDEVLIHLELAEDAE